MASQRELTVVILTKNEERVIARCIDSITFPADILVFDSESTDATVSIATARGARVVTESWQGDFSAQRNRADTHVVTPWVFHLDADEIVSPELAEELKALFVDPTRIGTTIARIPRNELIFGKWIEHGGWYPQYKLRLYRRGVGHWTGRVHEDFVGYRETPYTFRGAILHDSYRDVQTFIEKFNRYSTMDAETAFAGGSRFSFMRLIFQPIERFIGRYVVHRGYRDGMHGFVLAFLVALNYVMRQLKLWEKGLGGKE
ncbi:MAG: glycosyltransferase family 2 protein [Desulfuromonadia bacterium]